MVEIDEAPELSDPPTSIELTEYIKWTHNSVRKIDSEMQKLSDLRQSILNEQNSVVQIFQKLYPDDAAQFEFEGLTGKIAKRRRGDRVIGRPQIDYEIFGAIKYLHNVAVNYQEAYNKESTIRPTEEQVIQTMVKTYGRKMEETKAAMDKLYQSGELKKIENGELMIG